MSGWTDAALKGDLAQLRALLAEPSATKEQASEALTYAVIGQRAQAAAVLLEHGADPNRRGGYGQTPLFFAVTAGLPLVDLLLESDADVRARADSGADALFHYLSQVGPGGSLGTGRVEVAKRLLDAGLDIRGGPHVLVASRTAVPELLELVLAAGADPNATNRDGNALSAAMYLPKKPEMLAALVRGGIDPNTTSGSTTLLAEVCRCGDLGSAQALLERGADADAHTLAAAQESGNAVLVDLLLDRGATSSAPVLDGDAAKALDAAEHGKPSAPSARLAWASALLEAGFRAGAACEVAAVRQLGGEVPASLDEALVIERPTGVSWTFVEPAPTLDSLTPRTSDERFPKALVTDGARTLPLVVTLGTPCSRCDELGEETCSLCGGTGSYSRFLDPDHDVDCSPRQRCSACRGLKFVVTGPRMGKGSCKHPRLVDELRVGPFTFRRCADCGLAALRGPIRAGGLVDDDFACGVCGRFECRCG